MFKKNLKRGFTLIELLVVIAIIGILSGIVVTSLGGQRARARDARRTSEIQNIALAMQIYIDKNGYYPVALTNLVSDGLLAKAPVDPSTGNSYVYNGFVASGWSGTLPSTPATCNATTTKCQGFHIGANLETNDATLLSSDDDITNSAGIYGADTADCANGTTGFCYDIKNH